MQTIADMIIRLRNAQAVGAEAVVLPFSELKYNIAELLQQRGFLQAVEKKKKKLKKVEVPSLSLTLRYENGVGAINGMKLVSRSSRRVYAGRNRLHEVKSGYGIAVVSTSRGVMTGEAARQAGIGGEVLFEIW